jgi:hypothetical protein
MAKKKSKIKTEKETREHLLGWAKQFGCEAQLLKIFARYDDLMRGARTDEERKAIAAMGASEVHHFFGGDGALEVAGKTVEEDKRYIAQLARDAEEALRREAQTKKMN